MPMDPEIYIIAGPNGAGKSTLAPYLLKDRLHLKSYVNADLIALGLSAYSPETVALEAGRIMLRRLDELGKQHQSFGFETTLASRSYALRLQPWKAAGYSIHLVFLWLQSEEMAIERVRLRVQAGGHHIDEATIRRRYNRGVINFHSLYQLLANRWVVLDNSVSSYPQIIATGEAASAPIIYNLKSGQTFGQPGGNNEQNRV